MYLEHPRTPAPSDTSNTYEQEVESTMVIQPLHTYKWTEDSCGLLPGTRFFSHAHLADHEQGACGASGVPTACNGYEAENLKHATDTKRTPTTPTGGSEDQRIRGSDNLTRISFSWPCMRLTCRFPLMLDLQISPACRLPSKATGRRPVPHRQPTPGRHRLDLPNRCAACAQYHESPTAYYSHSTCFFTRSFKPCVCM